jgi:hypothetical protein
MGTGAEMEADMNARVENWLTRFAAGAGRAYVWTLIDGYDNTAKLLRAFLAEGIELCPLSAQATFDCGQVYPVTAWRAASAIQGMNEGWNGRIIQLAADDDTEADPEVRERLLTACQLL